MHLHGIGFVFAFLNFRYSYSPSDGSTHGSAATMIGVARSEVEPSDEDGRRGNLVAFRRNYGLYAKSGMIAALRSAPLAHLFARNDV